MLPDATNPQAATFGRSGSPAVPQGKGMAMFDGRGPEIRLESAASPQSVGASSSAARGIDDGLGKYHDRNLDEANQWHLESFPPGKRVQYIGDCRWCDVDTGEIYQRSGRSGPATRKQPASSSLVNDAKGGIDFIKLPMTIQPMGSFKGLNFQLPKLTQQQLAQINIDSEIEQIQRMASSGIAPSGERVKELVAACAQKGQLASCANNLLLCFIDICKLQEENACESSPEFREALVIVDSQA